MLTQIAIMIHSILFVNLQGEFFFDIFDFIIVDNLGLTLSHKI